MSTNEPFPTSTSISTSSSAHQNTNSIHKSATAIVVNATKIVEEFQYLLEKSQQLFMALKDLQPTGGIKSWQPYFQKTFEIYTKLWKFQQLHRGILENTDYYGIKRWEIGEIASKIGQLYYHYYLRTSDTNYLSESYVFYDAIRERQYFKDILEAKNPGLIIKKLRYHARFIVVCLLLGRHDVIKIVMADLNALVSEYTSTYKPEDADEWQLVLQEASGFVEATQKVVPSDKSDPSIALCPPPHRLMVDYQVNVIPTTPIRLRLQEAIIVGASTQAKFSELTVDMYRILQSLEREPNSGRIAKSSTENVSGAESNSSLETASAGKFQIKEQKKQNPHKYLLFKPSLNQLLLYLATACKESAEKSAVFLYFSADVSVASPHPMTEQGYVGGLATTCRKPAQPKLLEPDLNSTHTESIAQSTEGVSVHCLHPGDLTPFSRRPLFIVGDMSDGDVWKTIPMIFGTPIMILLAPKVIAPHLLDKKSYGSLFTLFLFSPLVAISHLGSVSQCAGSDWEAAAGIMSTLHELLSKLLISAEGPNVEKWKPFLEDDFLHRYLIRAMICLYFCRAAKAFSEEMLPSTSPELPRTVTDSAEVIAICKQLALKLAIQEDLIAFA